MNLENDNIKLKINEIDKILLNIELDDFSLFDGNAGLILFYLNMYRNTKKNIYLNKIHSLSNKCLKILKNKPLTFNYCEGVSGILWVLMQLKKNNIIDLKEGVFNEIDHYLIQAALIEIDKNNYDYLYGALGTILFWIERLPDPQVEYFIKILTEQLIKKCEEKNGLIKWRTPSIKKCRYDMGLCHGIPSILIILSLIHSTGILKSECERMIRGGVKWILQNKVSTEGSIFPTFIQNKTNNYTNYSRLGWCYGDMGIAATLWQVGARLKDISMQNEAIEIIKKTVSRTDTRKNGIYDASICHGSTGVAYIYDKFYFWTKQYEFKENADYWYDISIKSANFIDGYAGYKTWQGGIKSPKYLNCIGLLEGVIGVGLALTTSISKNKHEWDRCILLS